MTAKAKTEKEKLDQAAAKKKSKLASYQKQLASDKELLAWFEAEEKRQEEMDLASAKDGNARQYDIESTVRKEYDRKYRHQRIQHQRLRPKARKKIQRHRHHQQQFRQEISSAGTVLP